MEPPNLYSKIYFGNQKMKSYIFVYNVVDWSHSLYFAHSLYEKSSFDFTHKTESLNCIVKSSLYCSQNIELVNY